MAQAASFPSPVEIVADHKPRAEIVTAENPPRMVTLAAQELQTYLEKISGAHLEIVTQPRKEFPAKIYVGRSKFTDDLGIKTDNLANGAYLIRTGQNWLALVGRDKNFEPKGPWPRSHAEREQFFKDWDAMTGDAKWGNQFAAEWMRQYNKKLQIWGFDERGSLNAVYGFLRSLGVEWYMPGDLGEIVPQLASITVKPINETMRPDFGLRYHSDTPFWTGNTEGILWYLRQGLNSSSDEIGMVPAALSHGMSDVHTRKEFQEAHPDYMALRGGKRATEANHACFSSEGLFKEHVRYLRFLFDYYDMPAISVLPEDGAAYCEDPECVAKGTPERGWLGAQSDYVWDYVNRVAQELYKTHPNKKLTCLVYANYVLPPTNVDKLSPNLLIGLLIQRYQFSDPAKRKRYEQSMAAWRKMIASDAKIFVWSHYPFNAPGKSSHGMPEYMPHNIARSLKELKGLSVGELVETQFDPEKGGGMYAPIFNHLNNFLTARLYWNADQDVDKLLERYYKEFYGPAAQPMKEFVDFSEKNLPTMSRDKATVDQALVLLAAVKAAAGKDTVYAQRVQLLDDYFKPLRALSDRLAKGRQSKENIPTVQIQELKDVKITVDGKLDESPWKNLPVTGNLVNVENGQPSSQETSFRIFWSADSLYVGITCKEKDTARLSREILKHDDQRSWDSDDVNVLIETDQHAYYQLAVTPGGGYTDLDWVNGEINSQWESAADVATYVGKDYWSVEIRYPIAAIGHLDPLHNMVGAKPISAQPWYFNVCRIIGSSAQQMELAAFSPTGKRSFMETDCFAKLYIAEKDNAEKPAVPDAKKP